MSGATTRMASAEAGPVAKRFLSLIDGCTDQVYVAGSLRRRLPTVGDVEIVAVPKIEQRSTDMFSEFTTPVDTLHERLEDLLHQGLVEKRPRSDGALFWGPRAKYLVYDGVPIDLFSIVNDWRQKGVAPQAEPDRLGIILLIRTGPWTYSKRMVTPNTQTITAGYHRDGKRPILVKGLMPPIFRQEDGWLTYRTSGERIKTPTEQSVYDLYGLPYAEPWSRQ